jgi:hypothetical protein
LSENPGCYSAPPLRESHPRDLGVTALEGGLVSSSKVDGLTGIILTFNASGFLRKAFEVRTFGNPFSPSLLNGEDHFYKREREHFCIQVQICLNKKSFCFRNQGFFLGKQV